jgi:LacI family transcriptional regulator
MQAAGIRDVAASAGVSVATVSNVFNRPNIVAPETRRRVTEAVAALGYVRNESARQLRMGQSRTIGLILPDITNPFFTDIARGVEDTTSAFGSLLIVCNSDNEPDKEKRYLTMLAEQHVQGALTVPVRGAVSSARLLQDRGIPVVLLDINDRSGKLCSVAVNDVAGGSLAMAHLLGNGHRRVGFVGTGHDVHQAVDREKGAREALEGAGLDPGALMTLATTDLNFAGGTDAARRLLKLPPRRRPTAVTCVNDLLAVGLLHELLRSGARVPDDVAIVGYDDIVFAEAAAVPLSSVRQPRHELGTRAAQLLLAEADGDRHHHKAVVFEPELIIRASSDHRRRPPPPRTRLIAAPVTALGAAPDRSGGARGQPTSVHAAVDGD